MKIFYLFVITILSCLPANAITIYVNGNATGANTGASWMDAFVDLQAAIALSSFGDDIWVAQGTYKPTTGTAQSISFSIKNGTKLYGGFVGTETALTQRNVAVNVTILSGEIGSGSATDNTNTVTLFNNVANQTRLDGFTITGGHKDSDYGAGAKIIASSPIIANCIFQGNYAGEGGGAINHSISGILTLENCVFNGNVGNTYGGGALRLYTGTVNISGCYFKSNQSNTYGGAIFLYGAIVNITNSVFAGNIAQSSGSAIRVSDVGLLNLSNSLVVGNYTNQTGTITSSTFTNSSPHTIKNCTIAHNKNDNSQASSTSSTVALNNEATVSNSIIYGNISTNQILSTGLTFNYGITQSSTNNASGTSLLYSDPQFVSPGNASSAPFDTAGFNYQLNLLSPGIDAGINSNVVGTVDLAGNVRIHNNTVDIGAFEGAFCVSALQFTTPPPYGICGGTPINLAVDGGVDHLWSNGSTASSISVSTAGSYTVIFEDTVGCRGKLTANVTQTANPNPTITFTGGNLSVGSYATYQWGFNGSPISGATNSTHIPIQGYGNYSITVQNASGCIGTTNYCLSPAIITANGPTTFCQGDNVTLTVTDGNSYVWSTGSLNPSITVNSSGNYMVTVLNANAGCSVVLSQSVVVNPNPNPVVTFSGVNLSTGAFSSYQWNFNGSPIVGANVQNLNPTATGNGQYTVTVTNPAGCDATSSVFNLNNLELEEMNHSYVEYYPNPVESGANLRINLSEVMGASNQITIYSSDGKKVLQVHVLDSQNSISIPQLKSGVYYLTIQNEEISISGNKLTVL